MRRLHTALLSAGVLFLAYLVWRVGPRELWDQVRGLGWGVIPFILSEGLGNLAHTLGWRCCINKHQAPVPLTRLFRMAMAGFAINYLTPSASIGGEVGKAALLASTHPGPEAVGSVLLDKLATAFAHLLLAVLGSIFLVWRVSLPLSLWIAMAATSTLMMCGMVAFLWLQKQGKLGGFLHWVAARKIGGRLLQHATHHISGVDEALRKAYRERPLDLLRSVGWHLLGHSAALLQVWLFLWLIQEPASLSAAAGAGFLSLWFDPLTFAIPLNLGALEGSRIVSLKAVGCNALLGMAFGIAVRIAQVSWACFGLVCYWSFAARRPRLTPGKTTAGACARCEVGN